MDVGLSYGVDLSARVTRAVQAGFGAYEGDWVGLKEGRFAHWYMRRAEMGVSPFFFHEIYRTSDRLIDISHPIFTTASYDEYLNDLWLSTDRGFFSVGATVNMIFGRASSMIRVSSSLLKTLERVTATAPALRTPK